MYYRPLPCSLKAGDAKKSWHTVHASQRMSKPKHAGCERLHSRSGTNQQPLWLADFPSQSEPQTFALADYYYLPGQLYQLRQCLYMETIISTPFLNLPSLCPTRNTGNKKLFSSSSKWDMYFLFTFLSGRFKGGRCMGGGWRKPDKEHMAERGEGGGG